MSSMPKNNWVKMPVGTYEEGLAFVGRSAGPYTADIPIDLGLIKVISSLVEDSNPAYWSPEVSEEIWGAQIAPASLLTSIFCKLPWYPGEEPPRETLAGDLLPLPTNTLILVKAEHTLFRPLRLGDLLTSRETLKSLSGEKQTALGPGYFITTETEYRDADGELVALGRSVMLRYTTNVGDQDS